MWGFLDWLVVALGLGVFWWRLEPLVTRLLAARDADRLLQEAIDLRADLRDKDSRRREGFARAGELKLAELRLAFDQAYAQDRIALEKHKIEAQKAAIETRDLKNQIPESQAMPLDLHIYVSEQSEPWARDQLREKAGELYAEYKDWDKVREALFA